MKGFPFSHRGRQVSRMLRDGRTEANFRSRVRVDALPVHARADAIVGRAVPLAKKSR